MYKTPADFTFIIKKAYTYLIVTLLILSFISALKIEVDVAIFYVKLLSSIVTVFSSFVFIATLLLIANINRGIKQSLGKFTTAEFDEITSFWETSKNFAQNQMMTFGALLAFINLVEYLITVIPNL